jgi:hypothetical protein
LIAMQVTGAACTRRTWDPFAPQPDLWAQKAGLVFLTSQDLLTLDASPLPPRVPTDRYRLRPQALPRQAVRMKTLGNTRTKHRGETN